MLTGSGLGWALDAMDVGLISFIIASLAVQWNLEPSRDRVDRLDRLRRHGDRRERRRSARRPVRPTPGLRRHPARLRARDRCQRARGRTRRAARAAVPRRSRTRRRAAGRVDLRERVRAGAHARPADRDPRGVLGDRLDGRRAHRLPRHPRLRQRLAMGLRARRDPGRLRARRPLGAAGVRTMARAPRPARARPSAVVALVRGVRRRRRAPSRTSSVRADTAPAAAARPRASASRALWSAEFRVRTACLWLVWFCVNFSYYGAFIWIPSILVAQGYDLVRSFGFTLIITLAQLPGYAVAAWLIEVWGRRLTLSVFLAGSAVVGDPLRHGGRRSRPSSPPAWRCRSSTSARGARCTPSHPRCTRRRCARPVRGGQRGSGASRRSSLRSTVPLLLARRRRTASVRRLRGVLRDRRDGRVGTRRSPRTALDDR